MKPFQFEARSRQGRVHQELGKILPWQILSRRDRGGFESVEQNLFRDLKGAAGDALLDERFNLWLVDFDARRVPSFLI